MFFLNNIIVNKYITINNPYIFSFKIKTYTSNNYVSTISIIIIKIMKLLRTYSLLLNRMLIYCITLRFCVFIVF